MIPFADAGPGPLLIPILGCVAVAGLLLAVGIVLGGILLIRRLKKPPS